MTTSRTSSRTSRRPANVKLAQNPRPTTCRRRMTDGELLYRELEAERVIAAQQRYDAEQAHNNHVALVLAAALTIIGLSGLIAEHVLYVIAMAFSAC